MTQFGADSTLRSLFDELAAARGKLAGRASLAMLERTLARDEMPPLHVHEEPEAFHVLDGTLVVVVGDETVRLEAGDAYVAPAGVAHTYRAGSEHARYLALAFVRSTESYERFLHAVSRPEDAHPARPPLEDERVVATLAAANRITVLGPPGAVPSGESLAA